MICKYCGRQMKRIVTPFRRPVKGEMLEVKDIEVFFCQSCGAMLIPNETLKFIGKKTGERLLEVAKRRGRISDVKEYLWQQRKKYEKKVEEELKEGKIKKKQDAPLKVFT